MRVVIKFHETARNDYEKWQTRLGEARYRKRRDRPHHVEELIRRLEETNGLPTEAKFHAELEPPSWIWRFSSDTWVRFMRKETRTGLWGSVTAEVLIIGVSVHPPD